MQKHISKTHLPVSLTIVCVVFICYYATNAATEKVHAIREYINKIILIN